MKHTALAILLALTACTGPSHMNAESNSAHTKEASHPGSLEALPTIQLQFRGENQLGFTLTNTTDQPFFFTAHGKTPRATVEYKDAPGAPWQIHRVMYCGTGLATHSVEPGESLSGVTTTVPNHRAIRLKMELKTSTSKWFTIYSPTSPPSAGSANPGPAENE